MNVRREDSKKTTIDRFNMIVSERNTLIDQRQENSDAIDLKNNKLQLCIEDIFISVARYKKVNLEIIINGDNSIIDFYIMVNRPMHVTCQTTMLIQHQNFLMNKNIDIKTLSESKRKLMKTIDYYKSFTGLVIEPDDDELKGTSIMSVSIKSRTKYFK